MADPKDIYRLSNEPPVRRRRRKKRRSSSRASLSDRIHSKIERLSWVLLLLVLIGYVAALGFMKVRSLRQTRQNAAQLAAVAPKPAEAVETEDPDRRGPSTAEITEWMGMLERVERTLRDSRAVRDDPNRAAELETRLVQELERAPELLGLKSELARHLNLQGRHEEAADFAMQVMYADPDRIDAALLLAESLVALDQHEAALHVAERIVKLDPFSMNGHRLAMRAYLAVGQPGPAIQHIERLLSAEPGNQGLQNQLALAHASLGQIDKGIELLRATLRRDAGNQAAHFYLATLQARAQRAAEAVDTLSLAAREFGYPFVSTWLESGEFDGIRDEVVFSRFRTLTRSLLGEVPPVELEEDLP